jgi:hypothetical protein
MRRIQVAARGGGECARTGTLADTGCGEAATAIESIRGTATNAIATCWFASPLLASGGENGCAFFFETAQQFLFAQQFGLQPAGSGAFERMHEAAGSWSGRTAIANTTAIRIGAVFRMENIYHTRSGASTLGREAVVAVCFGIGAFRSMRIHATMITPTADIIGGPNFSINSMTIHSGRVSTDALRAVPAAVGHSF